MKDFFISYTARDEAWAEWIAWQLEQAGYSTAIQRWDFRPGSNFVTEMQKASVGSERTLAVLSPDYLRSAYGMAEFASAFADDPAGEKGKLVPVRVRETDTEGLLRAIIHVDLVGLEEALARERLFAGVVRGRLRPADAPPFPGRARPLFPGEVYALGETGSEGLEGSESADLPLDEVPEPGALPAGSRMPLSRNPLFVGRADDLRELARCLCAGETAVVGQAHTAAATGLGGIGKTQLACEFVHRYGRFFTGGVFWLSFADPAAVPAEVAACGLRLAGPEVDGWPLERQVRYVQEAWRLPVARLLVFDNCEDLELLARWRPPAGGCRVLVTSRRASWEPSLGVRPVALGTLLREESVALLRGFRPDLQEDPALGEIAAEVGDLPLALHLTGSFLARYRYASAGQPAAYLEQLRQGELLEHPSLRGWGSAISPTGHARHVARTFALSHERLEVAKGTDVVARSLLARASFFAPGEPIPRSLLLATGGFGDGGTDLGGEDALMRLVELGLVEEEPGGAVKIHRLVAAFARGTEDEKTAQAAVESTVVTKAEQLNQAGFPAPLLAWQPHLRAVTDAARERDDERSADLCNELGYHLWMIGDFSGARTYAERS